MTACSSELDVNAFIQLTDSPAGRRYWIEEKRTIIYNIFKTEIFNDKLSLPEDKVREAITQLGETQDFRTQNRIRAFLYRLRKQGLNKSVSSDTECNSPAVDSPSLSEEDRREKLRKFWTKDKRRVIYKVLKKEILDLNSRIPTDKLLKVIDQIGENPTKRDIARLRTFVTSVRRQRKRRVDAGNPVTPLPSDSESTDEDTDENSDDVAQSSNANGENSDKTSQNESEVEQDSNIDSESSENDKDSGKGHGPNSNHCQDECKVDSDTLNGITSSEKANEDCCTESSENTDERKLENGLKESELDAVEELLSKNRANAEKQTESASKNTGAETICEPDSVEVAKSSTNNDTLESKSISECIKEETKDDCAEQPLNENDQDISNSLEDTLESGEQNRTADIGMQSPKIENDTISEIENEVDSKNNTAESPQNAEKTLEPQDLSVASSLTNDFSDVQTSSEDDTIAEILRTVLSKSDSNESSFDNGTQETKFDPAVESSNGNYEDYGINTPVSSKRKLESGDSNEVLISPKRKKTQWTSEMTSVLKNHFARELSQSNWPTEPGKVDFITNFLKSNGFRNMTSETVFNWADNHFKERNNNSESFSDQITGYLVAGVINGSIGLDSISKSYQEQRKLPKYPPEASETEEPFDLSDIPLPPEIPIDQNFSDKTGPNQPR